MICSRSEDIAGCARYGDDERIKSDDTGCVDFHRQMIARGGIQKEAGIAVRFTGNRSQRLLDAAAPAAAAEVAAMQTAICCAIAADSAAFIAAFSPLSPGR